MDPTGWREWDCSRMLHALLTSDDAAAVLGGLTPARILELGAGTGALALRLAASALPIVRYDATDVDGRLPPLRRRVAELRLDHVVRVSKLLWGAPPPAPCDLVLCSELLYWPGADLFADDGLAPLAATLCAALRSTRTAVGLVAYRERDVGRERRFIELCAAAGGAVERCDARLVAAHAPRQPGDPELGAMVLLRVVAARAPARCFVTTEAAELVHKIGKTLLALGALGVEPRFQEHRVFFHAEWQKLGDLTAVSGVERVFLSLLDVQLDDATCALFHSPPDFTQLARWFEQQVLEDAIHTWAALHGREPRTWALKATRLGAKASRCRRHVDQGELQHQARRVVGELMPAAVEPTRHSAAEGEGAPDLMLQLRVSPTQASAGLLLFVRRVKQNFLVHKGLHHSVSWGLARTAALRAAEVVCDPCCGTAALLVEAREHWPAAAYIGADIDAAQLRKAATNAAAHASRGGAAAAPLALCQADCGALPLRDGSVDCCLSDLPFGRQHGSVEENSRTLYPRLLREMGRVLRERTGRAVLLTAAASASALVDAEALGSAGLRLVNTQPLRFCNIDCVMVLLAHGTSDGGDPEQLFDFKFRERAGASTTHSWKLEKPMLMPRRLAP
ncbi:hypothetical protein AB1Y20_009673 [Prymnesium parvum]|uniref:Ribosomal RNA large subunit methyltransferase K/L-like methyltransferase domain-containing protein n=1 Tax=Prymnesium parvum TaxID=97485 RepID=A0AB34K1H7_PRYPA